MGNRQKWKNLRNYGGNKYLRFGKLRGPYLFSSYQFAKFKDQINIGPGYQVISADQMLLFIRMKPNLKYIVMIKQRATISPKHF